MQYKPTESFGQRPRTSISRSRSERCRRHVCRQQRYKHRPFESLPRHPAEKGNPMCAERTPAPPDPHVESAEAVIARYAVDSERRPGSRRRRRSSGEARRESTARRLSSADVAVIPRPGPRADRRHPYRSGRCLGLIGGRERDAGHPGQSAPERYHRLHTGRTCRARRARPCSGSRLPWPRPCVKGGFSPYPPATACPAIRSFWRPATASRPMLVLRQLSNDGCRPHLRTEVLRQLRSDRPKHPNRVLGASVCRNQLARRYVG